MIFICCALHCVETLAGLRPGSVLSTLSEFSLLGGSMLSLITLFLSVTAIAAPTFEAGMVTCNYASSMEAPETESVEKYEGTFSGNYAVWKEGAVTYTIRYQKNEYTNGHLTYLVVSDRKETILNANGEEEDLGTVKNALINADLKIIEAKRAYKAWERPGHGREVESIFSFDGGPNETTYVLRQDTEGGGRIVSTRRDPYDLKDAGGKDLGRVLTDETTCTYVPLSKRGMQRSFHREFLSAVEKFQSLYGKMEKTQRELEKCQSAGKNCDKLLKKTDAALAARDAGWEKLLRAKKFVPQPPRPRWDGDDYNPRDNRRLSDNYRDNFGRPVYQDNFRDYYDDKGFPMNPRDVKDRFGRSVCEDAFHKPMRGC